MMERKTLSLNDKIRLARLHRGLTHREAAEALGVTAGSFAQWEQGLTKPRPKLWPGLCKLLGLSMEDFEPPPRGPGRPYAQIKAERARAKAQALTVTASRGTAPHSALVEMEILRAVPGLTQEEVNAFIAPVMRAVEEKDPTRREQMVKELMGSTTGDMAGLGFLLLIVSVMLLQSLTRGDHGGAERAQEVGEMLRAA